MSVPHSVIEAQLDWLTLSAHGKADAAEVAGLASVWAQAEARAGQDSQPFHSNGYAGWRCGRVALGTRDQASLVQLSGDLANAHLRQLWPLRSHVTRIDVATTVRLATPDAHLGQLHYAQAVDHYSTHPRAARPEAKQDADGGFTCYIGARTADYYFRCYNKERECQESHDEAGAQHYRGCWRYELEVKGAPASLIAKQALEAPHRPTWAQALLHDYTTAHGLEPVFDRGGGQALVAGFRRRSDDDTRLAWLEKSVAKAVATLMEHGRRADVLRALGLEDR